MAAGSLTIEEVGSRASLRRFVDLPHLLFHDEPRWAAPVASWVQARLDPHRNPFFVEGDAAYFLLRRRGRPAGRITAHVAADGDEAGWFGFYDVDDDVVAAGALVGAAAAWLRDQGCTTMTGPVSFTMDDEAGVLVAGHDAPGRTGRGWQPAWYATGLVEAGLVELAGSRRSWWRLAADAATADPPPPAAVPAPALIGPYADRRLLLPGITAVPDLLSAASSQWGLAKRAKRGDWIGCTVVSCAGDPAVLVPGLVAAAKAAGYEWVEAPWAPPGAGPPEAQVALFTTRTDQVPPPP